MITLPATLPDPDRHCNSSANTLQSRIGTDRLLSNSENKKSPKVYHLDNTENINFDETFFKGLPEGTQNLAEKHVLTQKDEILKMFNYTFEYIFLFN